LTKSDRRKRWWSTTAAPSGEFPPRA
jgi:hypothetical protein